MSLFAALVGDVIDPSNPYLNLLVQVPLVGIFAWLMLEVMKRQDVREATRDKLHSEERKEREERERNERRERDDQWRSFLQEQRQQFNDTIGRIAEEVKLVTNEVKHLANEQAEMRHILTSHDAASREARSYRPRTDQ